MPQPKIHASHAARQAAYHQRTQQARQEQLCAKGLPALPILPNIPGYPRWRQAVKQAQILLDMVRAEMEDYAEQRSDQWQETERAETLRQQIDNVAAAGDQVSELEL